MQASIAKVLLRKEKWFRPQHCCRQVSLLIFHLPWPRVGGLSWNVTKRHVPDILVSTCSSGNLGGKCAWLHCFEFDPNSLRGRFEPAAGRIWWEWSWKLYKGKAELEKTLQSSAAATLTSFVLIQTLPSPLHLLSHNQCSNFNSIVNHLILSFVFDSNLSRNNFCCSMWLQLSNQNVNLKMKKSSKFQKSKIILSSKYCVGPTLLVGNYIVILGFPAFRQVVF